MGGCLELPSPAANRLQFGGQDIITRTGPGISAKEYVDIRAQDRPDFKTGGLHKISHIGLRILVEHMHLYSYTDAFPNTCIQFLNKFNHQLVQC